MTQFVTLSDKAQDLVNNYVNNSIAKSPFDSNILKKLLISVYRYTASVDVALLSILEKYVVDITDYYTDEDIQVFLKEYSALAIYCHQHDEIFYSSSSNQKTSAIAGFQASNSDFSNSNVPD